MKLLLSFCLLFSFAFATFGQKAETTKIKVYFLNAKNDPNLEDCRNVRPTERVVPKNSRIARASLEELFKGVTADEKAKGFVSFSSDETSGILKGINLKRGTAYVNFNKIVYEKLGSATSSCGGGLFSSIEATLKQFPTVKNVFYAIEGSPRDFYDWVQVGECPKELRNCDGRNFR